MNLQHVAAQQTRAAISRGHDRWVAAAQGLSLAELAVPLVEEPASTQVIPAGGQKPTAAAVPATGGGDVTTAIRLQPRCSNCGSGPAAASKCADDASFLHRMRSYPLQPTTARAECCRAGRVDPANASVVAKIVTRLNDLGISDAGMAMADADAVRGRALSLLAQKLVAKVPEKVCSLLSGLHAESPLRRIKLQRMLQPLQLTAVVPRLLQAVSVAQMHGAPDAASTGSICGGAHGRLQHPHRSCRSRGASKRDSGHD